MNMMRVTLAALAFGWLTTDASQAFYNPETGRWLSRDPIGELGFAGGYTVVAAEREDYVFVLNSPVEMWDVLGLKKTKPGYYDWQKCKAPEVWQVMPHGMGVVPAADGCSVPVVVVKAAFPKGGSADDPSGKCSFKPACDAHDYCYSNCKRTKLDCDERFKRDMKKACDGCAAGIGHRGQAAAFKSQCYRWAETYARGVDARGRWPYVKRQVKNCMCECTKCANPAFCPHPND